MTTTADIQTQINWCQPLAGQTVAGIHGMPLPELTALVKGCLGSPEAIQLVTQIRRIRVKAFKITSLEPGSEPCIWGIGIYDDNGEPLGAIPGILAVDRLEAISIRDGRSPLCQPAFRNPPQGKWTYSLFKEWISLFGMSDSDYPGKFSLSEGGTFSYIEEGFARTTYQGGIWTHAWNDGDRWVETSGATPEEAFEYSRSAHPLQGHPLRPTQYRPLCRDAVTWAISQPQDQSGRASLDDCSSLDDIYRALTQGVVIAPQILEHYAETHIRVVVAHRRALDLFGPEGELKGYKG